MSKVKQFPKKNTEDSKALEYNTRNIACSMAFQAAPVDATVPVILENAEKIYRYLMDGEIPEDIEVVFDGVEEGGLE